ncbi:MAG TPA: aminotransferase class III-fold pyridoxal phosphate-dependent enzyme [Solirubrobacteraceae bacterium]|nr:aminotransferase class III-fold pyridoxal phosphate-dependent enzyme [Solirubrobacteraceae bacterium]
MQPSETERLRQLDRTVLWHPFTQQQEWMGEDAPVVAHARGTTLYDTEGRSYVDGVSSLWCTVHGHRHPALDAAVRRQLDQVAHTTMAGLSHPAAIELGARLVDLAPKGLSRVFYSDSGSAAVEVALRMARQWWAQRGEPGRTRFVSLRNACHGPSPSLLGDGAQAEPGDAESMERLLRDGGGQVAAVVVEPLVQGAAGMLVHPDGYLRAVRELCDRYGVLLVCDEAATGFGRTGTMFACEQEGVSPDLLCLADGLTGGYLPLAATLTTERVYEGFLGTVEELRTFAHGHAYAGNPLACAAALATLEVFERERTLERLQPKIELLGDLLDREVAPLPAVAEVRRRGFMVGIELGGFPLAARIGHQATLAARRRGAIVRPVGDTVVLMPPLSIERAELRRLVEITAEAIAEATGAAGALAEAA